MVSCVSVCMNTFIHVYVRSFIDINHYLFTLSCSFSIAFGEVLQVQSKHGVYDSNKKIITWSSAALDIRKSPSLQLDIAVHVPVTLSKIPNNVPIIVKGFYR